jgi:anti-sigma B factor antagonist
MENPWEDTMNIEKECMDNAITLKVSGRLDTTTAPTLETAVSESVASCEALVLDFSGLEYISSAGLRVILNAQKAMAAKGGMIIKNVNETIMEIFEITGFSDILTIA